MDAENYIIKAMDSNDIRVSKDTKIPFENSVVRKMFPKMAEEFYNKVIEENEIFSDFYFVLLQDFSTNYNIDLTDTLLYNNRQFNINSRAHIKHKNRPEIYLDRQLEDVVLTFLSYIFLWSDDLDKNNYNDFCFNGIRNVLRKYCMIGNVSEKEAIITREEKEKLLNYSEGRLEVMDVVCQCYWGIIYFTMAHELAHVYQFKTDYEYWDNHPKEAEINADTIACNLLSCLIENPRENISIDNYAYLSPLMFFDFVSLLYRTNRIVETSETHPLLGERKNHYFNIVYDEKYTYDTVPGNNAYRCFMEIYELFEKIEGI